MTVENIGMTAICIIDYGIGNLKSIKNMLKKVGCTDVLISAKEEDIAKADKLILPGVGHFDYGMRQLRAAPCFDVLNKRVLEDKIPVLGICLGAQLLFEKSEEGKIPGLAWIKGNVIRFEKSKMDPTLKIPHMGWNEIMIDKKDSLLFQDMHVEPRFYFVHTYHMQCEDSTDVLTTAHYGYDFVAGVERANIMGVQFHPEKSHKFGMKLLKNFVKNY